MYVYIYTHRAGDLHIYNMDYIVVSFLKQYKPLSVCGLMVF